MKTGAQYAAEMGGHFNEPDCKDLSHIPGKKGWPILGSVAAMAKDINGLHNEVVENFGHVSRFTLPGFDGVLVLHPDDLQQVYMDKNKDFSSYMGYKPVIGNFYDGGIIMRDFDDHRFQRRLFQNAFKNKALKDYMSIINPTIQQNIDTWQPSEKFLFVEGARQILLDIAARVFIGLDQCQGEDARLMHKAFHDINEKGLLAVVKKDLPFTNFRKGKQGEKYLTDYFEKMIPQRRENPGKDLMSLLVQEKDEEGHYWPNDVLIPHLNLLMFAAHDTTTGTLSHTMMYLAQPKYQHWQDKLREQAMAKDSDFLDYEELEDMTDYQNCIQEALRLHPSLTIAPRRTVRDVTMRGILVPANTQIFAQSHWAHRSSEFWTNPEEFDPERFSDERKEYKSHPFAYTPFGGGAHKCLGMHFAMVNGKLVLHQLLRKYKFEIADGYTPNSVPIPMPFPTKKLPVKLTRID